MCAAAYIYIYKHVRAWSSLENWGALKCL